MNKRTALALAAGIALCLPSASHVAQAAPTPPPTTIRPKTTLDADPRLDRRVTFHGVGVSLADLATALSDKTIALRADPDCADLKVQVRVRNQPLRSVMAGLAQLLPGAWVPSDAPGRGYDLSMSRDAQADRAHWWDTFLAERDRELASMRQKVLESMQAPAVASPPDPAEGNGGSLAAYRGQRFFNTLPAPLQVSIADTLDDTLYYGSTSGVSITFSGLELHTVLPLGSLPTEAQGIMGQALEGIPNHNAGAPDLSSCFVAFANYSLGVSASLWTSDGHDLGTFFDSSAWQGSPLPGLFLDQSALPTVVDQSSSDAPLAWQVLADYQRRRFWRDDAPAQSGKPHAMTDQPTRNVDWLTRVGNKADIDYVADYHSLPQRVMTAPEMDAPLAGPLKRELDAQADARDISWKKTGDGLYLFRDNRWYRDDELEVPNAVLKQIKAELPRPTDARAVSPPAAWPDGPAGVKCQIDAEADIAARLTPWQIANGLALYVPEPADDAVGRQGIAHEALDRTVSPDSSMNRPFAGLGRRILAESHTLAFYAGLDDDERAALVGGALPVGTLGADHQALAVALAPQLAALLSPSPNGGTLPLLGIRRASASGVMMYGKGEEQALRLFVPPPPMDGTTPAIP